MEIVLLDRSSGSFELPKMSRRATPRGAYNSYRSIPTYHHHHHQQQQKRGAWSSAPAFPYAARPPMIYSSPSLPLLPSNQPPLLPLPPTATNGDGGSPCDAAAEEQEAEAGEAAANFDRTNQAGPEEEAAGAGDASAAGAGGERGAGRLGAGSRQELRPGAAARARAAAQQPAAAQLLPRRESVVSRTGRAILQRGGRHRRRHPRHPPPLGSRAATSQVFPSSNIISLAGKIRTKLKADKNISGKKKTCDARAMVGRVVLSV